MFRHNTRNIFVISSKRKDLIASTYIHTYIYIYIIGHFNPSVRIIDLVSHTTYVVCVSFIHKWRDLQLTVDSERQIFYLFILRVFARNLLRENRRRNTFRISFWCLAWGSNSGFSSNKPTHYLLDHGDFFNFASKTLFLFWWRKLVPKKFGKGLTSV